MIIPALFFLTAGLGGQPQSAEPTPTLRAAQRTRNAEWITAPGPASRPDRIYVRQRFRLSDSPEVATLRVGGRGDYTVYLNGGLILRGSGDVAQNVYVTRYIAKGSNVVAIECQNRADAAALEFELAIRYRTGRTALVV